MNLFINYYIDKDVNRQKELDFAVEKNIANEFIKNIIVFCDREAVWKLLDFSYSTKLCFIVSAGRPSFNNFFAKTQDFRNDINIIANTDIYFDETAQLIKDYDWKDNSCMALARWDLQPDGNLEHFNRQDSNDVWIFKGGVPEIAGADFTLGKPGCDNKILYLLNMKNYNIINPSLTIKTIHVHQSGIRNYTPADILPPPYHFVNPHHL